MAGLWHCPPPTSLHLCAPTAHLTIVKDDMYGIDNVFMLFTEDLLLDFKQSIDTPTESPPVSILADLILVEATTYKRQVISRGPTLR